MSGNLAELLQILEQKLPDKLEIEERTNARPVSWQQYEKLLLELEDNAYYRVTYLNLKNNSPYRVYLR